MKKYLLTWYGLTDLKASLGLENTGPVLGALLAEDYTDVVILGYTKNEKITSKIETHTKLINLSHTSNTNEEESWNLLDDYANTKEAHLTFKKWLLSSLTQHDKSTDVNLYPVILNKLNDTEGIYKAVIDCLDMISSKDEEKEVTLYLSPGTPVMAFSWAFATLLNPALHIRIIASSNFLKPPETISIPYELLEWKGVESPPSKEEENEFDTIFHLFGGQRMPSLFGIMQFKSKKHVFISSKEYSAYIMKQFIGSAKFDQIFIDAFDPKNIEIKILQYLKNNPSNGRIGFNLTGGTKLMYAGAMSVSKKINGIPFYFQTNHKMIFLNDFSSLDTKIIDNVETFIKLNGQDIYISKPGYWKDIPGIENKNRKQLTLTLWEYRSKIAKLYKSLIYYNRDFKPFEISQEGISIKLTPDALATIDIGGEKFIFENWPDFAKYLCGMWLEEYTYMLLEPFVNSGHIKDLRIGLEISIKHQKSNSTQNDFIKKPKSPFENTYQELDVVFTDGRRLYIIECKAGNVNSEYIMKLQNIVNYFGGIEGRGILAACFPPYSKVVKKKIIDSKNLQLVSGKNFIQQLESIIN